MSDSLLAQVAIPLVVIVLAVLGAVGALVLNEARKLTKQKQVQALLDRVAHFAQLVVGELNQTMVQPLKDASADGKLTLAEVTEIKNQAHVKFRELLTEKGMAEVKAVFGEAFTLLNAEIEATVFYMSGQSSKAVRPVVGETILPPSTPNSEAPIAIPSGSALP